VQRIFLCSDQHEKHTPTVNAGLFDALKDTNQRILYIPSESDASRRYFRKCVDYYGYLGFSDVIYFDLGMEYDPKRLEEVSPFDVIHLSGGRTAPFLRSIAAKGFAARLNQHLSKGGIIVGVSAGAMILGTHVFADGADPSGKQTQPGLRVLSFDILPHFDDSEAQQMAIGNHLRRMRCPVWGIAKDSALICSREAPGDEWQTEGVDPHGLSRYFST
jgi:dipeptidase E